MVYRNPRIFKIIWCVMHARTVRSKDYAEPFRSPVFPQSIRPTLESIAGRYATSVSTTSSGLSTSRLPWEATKGIYRTSALLYATEQ